MPLTATGRPQWAPSSISQALGLARSGNTVEPAPPVIPQTQGFLDASGYFATVQPSGATSTAGQPFFQPLGTNGRTCQTCHQPTAAWTITPPQIQAAFLASLGTAPLFRPVDGAVCP
ncbi:MAG: hypothetical protein JO157_14275, partial [Acetobacteraceae bacterium]|nr:hypothetical protein [Acetobacteraceae bacterium]